MNRKIVSLAGKLLTIAMLSPSCFADSLDKNEHSEVILSMPVEHIVKQKPEDFNCGIAAIMNALVVGGRREKLGSMLATDTDEEAIMKLKSCYALKPSVLYSSGARMRDDGISSPDLYVVYSEVRKDLGLAPMEGEYLDNHGLSGKLFLTSIHTKLLNSLQQGEPAIISVRSIAALWNEKRKDFFWMPVSAHAVTVISVPIQTSDDGSFSMGCLDSYSGKFETYFVYYDLRRFTAPKELQWMYMNERPFASVAGSSVNVHTTQQPWNARTITYLHYAIYAKKKDDEGKLQGP